MLLDRTPYVYLIGWTKFNKFYIGRRTAKNCNPSELWKTYFTSSNHVHQFQKMFGEPDIISIRKCFNSTKVCCIYETKLLKKLKAEQNPHFLNRKNGDSLWDGTNNAAAFCSTTGKYLGRISCNDIRWKTKEIHSFKTTEKAKQEIGLKNKNKAPAKDPNTLESLGSININDPRWETGEIVGIQRNKSHKINDTSNYKKPKSENHKQNMSRSFTGRIFSNDHKIHIKESMIGKSNAYKNGIFIGKFPINDPLFNNPDISKIKHIRTKAIAKCSLTGNSLGAIEKSDPRWETGEIVGIAKKL